jgi:Mg/Co/Ni transporter MgtE
MQMGGLPPPRLTADNIAKWLNGKNVTELKTLPGFIPAENALDSKTDRQKALEQMNALDVQTIPVVDAAKKFVGVVDRSKLTASILTDVAAKVEQ